MPEDLILHHPTVPEKTTRLEVDSRSDIGGGIDRKDRITGHVIPQAIDVRPAFDPRQRSVSLIERHPHSDHLSATELFKIWQHYKKIGLPVVPTFRVTSRDTVVTTDLKADKSEIYGKAMNVDWYYATAKKLDGLTDTDHLFVKLYPQIKEAISQRTQELSQLASENGVILPYDDPWELIFHPDGSWELMTLDLEMTEFKNPGQRFSVEMQNGYNVSDFLKNVDDVWEMLHTYST